MKTVEEIKNELSNLEQECDRLEAEKREIKERLEEIDSRLRVVKGSGAYRGTYGLVHYAKIELMKAEQLELDSKLAKCIFLDSTCNKNLVVAKVTPKQIQVKIAGESATTSFNRVTGQAPNSSPYWRLKLDVDKTLANYQLNQV